MATAMGGERVGVGQARRGRSGLLTAAAEAGRGAGQAPRPGPGSLPLSRPFRLLAGRAREN